MSPCALGPSRAQSPFATDVYDSSEDPIELLELLALAHPSAAIATADVPSATNRRVTKRASFFRPAMPRGSDHASYFDR